MGSPCPFPSTITITLRTPLFLMYHQIKGKKENLAYQKNPLVIILKSSQWRFNSFHYIIQKEQCYRHLQKIPLSLLRFYEICNISVIQKWWIKIDYIFKMSARKLVSNLWTSMSQFYFWLCTLINSQEVKPHHWCQSYVILNEYFWRVLPLHERCSRHTEASLRERWRGFRNCRVIIQEIKWVKLATVVEDDPKVPFSIATTPKCRGGYYSIP